VRKWPARLKSSAGIKKKITKKSGSNDAMQRAAIQHIWRGASMIKAHHGGSFGQKNDDFSYLTAITFALPGLTSLGARREFPPAQRRCVIRTSNLLHCVIDEPTSAR